MIVLGGMGSVIGTLVGGSSSPSPRSTGRWRSGPQYQNLIVFGLLVVILVIRPQGILGRKLA